MSAKDKQDGVPIPVISKVEFEKRLRKRPPENMQAIKSVEDFLKRKRGYVFRMPPPGAPVIHLVSGGIESTVLWGLMLERYKLHVYPLFLHRGMDRWKKEKEAVVFFASYFCDRYPEFFHEPFVISTNVVPPEIEIAGRNSRDYYHPARILESYTPGSGLSTIFSQGGLPAAYPFYGLSYASHLWDHENIKVHHFFNGVAPGDGDFVASQTFSTLRAIMFSMSLASGNMNLQFGSLAFEKEIGHWLEKKDLIVIGARMGLPLEQTWSCYRSGRYQCGDRCLTCHYRRLAFRDAGVADRTKYFCDTFFENRRRQAVSLWKRLTRLGEVSIVEETSSWQSKRVKCP